LPSRTNNKDVKSIYKNKVMYISNEYFSLEELKENVVIRFDFSEEILGKYWNNYNFDKAEKRILELQCKLTMAVFSHNAKKMRQLQEKIVYSSEARMLAVKKISQSSKGIAGVDGNIWRKSSEKMKAAILLNNEKYEANPLKFFEFIDEKTGKTRTIGVPTMKDRAMQVIYSYALEPIAEATGDRKSFAFRKGRSPQLAHATITDCFMDSEGAEWVLITDIKAYYNSISHKWLMKNIPIDKRILKEFLNCGYILNGEFFNKEEGISLGSNMSTILGNMVLDGLQRELYNMQGKEIKDFKNGYCVRFADDILVSARTEKDAKIFLEKIKKFVAERGLELSEEKTKIVNIRRNGFEFLSRFYIMQDGALKCIPSDKAIKNFELEMEELIFNKNGKQTQSNLIKRINAKIAGFTTYHKCEEATDTFRYLDIIINALLLKFMTEKKPELMLEQIQKQYWIKDSIR